MTSINQPLQDIRCAWMAISILIPRVQSLSQRPRYAEQKQQICKFDQLVDYSISMVPGGLLVTGN